MNKSRDLINYFIGLVTMMFIANIVSMFNNGILILDFVTFYGEVYIEAVFLAFIIAYLICLNVIMEIKK